MIHSPGAVELWNAEDSLRHPALVWNSTTNRWEQPAQTDDSDDELGAMAPAVLPLVYEEARIVESGPIWVGGWPGQ